MVQFKDFILIENKKDFDVDKFYADCEPFIKKIRGISARHLPMHGLKTVLDTWEIKRLTQREKPRDMPIEMHNAIDDYFEARFGWRARSQSIFTVGDYDKAKKYGREVALCFPIGENFQTLWGKDIKDLYNWLFRKKILQDEFGNPIYVFKDEMVKMIPSKIEKTIAELKKVRWYYNEMIKEGYESRNEVLVNADKVYIISTFAKENYDMKVINHLKSLGLITSWFDNN